MIAEIAQRVDWFDSLTFEKVEGEILAYKKSCACGSSIQFFGDTEELRQWIDEHFQHGAGKVLKL